MAQVLRMPSEWELPESPQRQFVEELFAYYREAGRPTLRSIADDIAEDPEFDAFTASRETIRKMLRGKTIPVSWAVVDAVLTVLCARAGIDPNHPRWAGGFAEEPVTHRQNLRNRWNEALDAPPLSPAPPSGWGRPPSPAAGHDEPPF
ncbi:hypothetical protein [Streptomyces sp. NPDC045470]|uniref:hypothetical protein n=1 Tax=Streptomyces sp. NPDC045470 TaxID=3155469 RepID=UPI0033E1FD41